VAAESHDWDAKDIRLLIPHIARNAHGSQDTAPLQSIVIDGKRTYAEIFAWTAADANDKFFDSISPLDMEVPGLSARLVFRATANSEWRDGSETEIFDAMVERLPMNTVSSLVAKNPISFSKEVWLRHAPRLAMLKRVYLPYHTSAKPFRQMLAEDTPPGGPLRLPSLTKIVLHKYSLTALRTYHLRDMLIKRNEQGAPLETLDLRTCIASEHAIQLLAEIVGDVKGPAEALERGHPALFDWRGGVTFFDEEELAYDDDNDDELFIWYDGRGFVEDEEDGDVGHSWFDDDDDDDSDPYDELLGPEERRYKYPNIW
jgi:hypothetical protein